MIFWWGFGVGVFMGACVGYFLFSILNATKQRSVNYESMPGM